MTCSLFPSDFRLKSSLCSRRLYPVFQTQPELKVSGRLGLLSMHSHQLQLLCRFSNSLAGAWGRLLTVQAPRVVAVQVTTTQGAHGLWGPLVCSATGASHTITADVLPPTAPQAGSKRYNEVKINK